MWHKCLPKKKIGIYAKLSVRTNGLFGWRREGGGVEGSKVV